MTSHATQIRDGSPRNGAKARTQDEPSGYKRTEAGVLPRGWRASRLGDHSTMRSGGTPNSSIAAYYNGGIPWVSISDMTHVGKIITQTERTLSEEGLAQSAAQMFPAGTLLYAMYASIGQCSLAGGPVCSSQAILGIQTHSSLDTEYLYYWLSSQKEKIRIRGQQGTQVNLNKAIVQDLVLPLPDVREQRAIAEALSGVDGLLGALETLVAKKRAIKQAAMQQLLTGKTRLPGFSGEWETKSLRELFCPITNRNDELNDNVVTISAQDGFVRQEEFFSKRVASASLAGYYLIERGQFAYNRSYSTGYPMGAIKRLTTHEKAVVTTLYICFAVLDAHVSDPRFFEHYFEAGLMNASLSRVATEGGRAHGLLNITKSDFFGLTVTFPSAPEQKAISTFLSDMDAEIAAVEARRDKARAIKQGMMQQLLTGRVRLVKPEAAA